MNMDFQLRRLRLEQRNVIRDIMNDLSEQSLKQLTGDCVGELAVAKALSHKVANLIAVTADLVNRVEQIQEKS